MKKICLSVVAASVILFSAQTMSAQEAVQGNETSVAQPVEQKTEFAQVAIEDLPAEVQQAVERDLAGAVIAEAYVNETEAGQTFKLVLRTAEGDQKELYADSEGNWIDE